jgi:hypothetical protein
MKHIKIHIILIVAISVMLQGCMLLIPHSLAKMEEKIEKEEAKAREGVIVDTSNVFTQNGAANSVFVYGAFVEKEWKFTTHYNVMFFYQINPLMQNQVLGVVANTSHSYWTAQNVLPGGTFKALYFNRKSGNTTYYTYPGLRGRNVIDFVAPEKPGIYFAGRVEINKDGATIDRSPEEELRILKAMKVDSKTGDWEPLLKARIKELEDAQ